MLTRRRFLRNCATCALAATGAALLPGLPAPAPAQAKTGDLAKGFINPRPSPWFASLPDKYIRCTLCPHECEVAPGGRGRCEVRENRDGAYYSLAYGNPCAVHADPIEKKPFFHVLPATRSFSIATAGCNLECKFCQNWEISQARPEDTFNYDLSPEAVVAFAGRTGCRSIASTYVEPTIFFEYMIDIGRLARKASLLTVTHSNGYINPEPLASLCDYLDAACIDLKGFSDDYYRQMTGGALEPVLSTLKALKKRKIHTELVNLMVPTRNDDAKMIADMCHWVAAELGPDTPIHFSRFHPMYKLKSLPPTPRSTLEGARKTAMDAGLRFVYIGNQPGHEGENTFCPKCGEKIIARLGYQVQALHLKSGACGFCGQPIPGIWDS